MLILIRVPEVGEYISRHKTSTLEAEKRLVKNGNITQDFKSEISSSVEKREKRGCIVFDLPEKSLANANTVA